MMMKSIPRVTAQPPPSDDDWYLNLVWIERQKCLLLTHAGTLFSVFRVGVHVADLRPLGNYLVEAIEAELRAEGLPADTFSALEPDSVQLAKTASRSTLGFMTEMAFELRWIIADKRGLRRSASTTSTTRSAGGSGTAATTSARSNSSTNAATFEADASKHGAWPRWPSSVPPHVHCSVPADEYLNPTR